MKKFISFVRHSHPEVYKGILFLIAIGLIVYILPKQGKFKYEFQNLKGKPWHHDNLVAPFDFPIKKTDAELKAEKSEILNSTKPYFQENKAIYFAKKRAFALDFNEAKKSKNLNAKLESASISIGNKIIDSIYSKGIIEAAENIENQGDDYTVYLLYDDNEAEEREVGSFYTVESAYEYVKQQLNKYRQTVDTKFLLPLLENSITHSIVYDKATSEREFKQTLDELSQTRGIILKNQSIIMKGDIVDAKKYQILESLKTEYEEQSGGTGSYIFILLGQIIIVSICLSVLIVFLSFFRKEIFLDNAKITFILLVITLTVLMARIASESEAVSIYILPFCILTIIIRSFYDTRVALFVHMMAILIISFMAPNRFEFVFIQLLGGIVTIFSIVNTRNRSQIFLTAALVFATYSLAFTGINILQEGGVDSISAKDYAWFGISALLTLFSYPLIFVFEKIFGFISDVSLLELSDTNGKLLRELASRAPGTFQHSLQVANLAEEAIFTIGGNALLVRTGALYHDIGKMEMPMYFIENQANGVNPHDDLGFEESAHIIIGHVIKGIEIAKKHNLPEQIIDFIRTHHGTGMTTYFYRSFQKAFPEEKIDDEKFRYPGPIPYSKETAVLMMADSVEAASRSLQKYDVESIDHLVEMIITKQIEQNQFVNADITFKDINNIKKIFKKKLMNVYHVRVEYPR